MTSKNSSNKDLVHIQKQRLYVGSGVEDIVDSNLHTKLDLFGQYHADYREVKNLAVRQVVYNSEASKNEDEIAADIFSSIPGINHDSTVGYYLGLYVGHALEGSFREKGSSGGLVSWVAGKLLQSGQIDGLIHVKKSKQPGILFEYGISRTVEEVGAGSKSRYYPAELSGVLHRVKAEPGKYAVVGIPEIITELRLLAESDKQIDERIVYYFGLVAGHQKTTKYAEAIAWEYGILPGDLKYIDFRVKRNSGRAIEYNTTFTGTVEGRDRTFTVRGTDPFVSSWAHGFFKARFSDFTDNTFNEASDIAFGDAWLKEYADDPAGNNILIVRNAEIAEILRQGVENNEIKLDSVDAGTIIRSQKGLVHHTKDELPYRLAKEDKKYKWAPRKRKEPSDTLDSHRKKVQDARQEIAEKSHLYYKQAVAKGNFEYFRERMQPYIDAYDRLYGVEKPPARKRVRAEGAILTLPGYYNYGNVIQRYALQRFLRNNGHDFVSYIHSKVKNQGTIYKHPKIVYIKAPLRFVKRFLRHQKPYWYFPSLSDKHKEIKQEINLVNFVNKYIKVKNFDVNDRYDTYIVGSDQVWRKWRNDSEMLAYYFLAFLRGRKTNRIAYAASFGKDKINEVMSDEDAEYVRPFVEQFDAISVREKSAIEMIKNTWGVDGVENVVDPVLLLEKEEYSSLIDNSDVKNEEIAPIFSYVLDAAPETVAFMDRIRSTLTKNMTTLGAHSSAGDDALPPVELWMKGFRDAELVITNSFHGMMFSVINNTDFIVIGRKDGGLSRILDFLSGYGIEGRFVDEENLDEFDLSNMKPIDWNDINNKLKEQRQFSGDWLLRAIDKSKI